MALLIRNQLLPMRVARCAYAYSTGTEGIMRNLDRYAFCFQIIVM